MQNKNCIKIQLNWARAYLKSYFFNSMNYFREAQKQEIFVSTYICIVLTCNQSETFELSLLHLWPVNVAICQLVCVLREDILLIKDQRSLVERSVNILFWFKDGERQAPAHHIRLCSLCVWMGTAGHCLTIILMGTGYVRAPKQPLRSSSVNISTFLEGDH